METAQEYIERWRIRDRKAGKVLMEYRDPGNSEWQRLRLTDATPTNGDRTIINWHETGRHGRPALSSKAKE